MRNALAIERSKREGNKVRKVRKHAYESEATII